MRKSSIKKDPSDETIVMMMAAILLPCGLSVVCKIATPKGVFEVLAKNKTSSSVCVPKDFDFICPIILEKTYQPMKIKHHKNGNISTLR